VPGAAAPGARLGAIPGIVPALVGEVRGCLFRNRCGHAGPACAADETPVRVLGAGRSYRCVLPPDQARAPAAALAEAFP
jgi:peptide/nickel transport system ATP-binding protein